MVHFVCIFSRLFEVYGAVDPDFKDKGNDGGDEQVDEHRLHANILQQLQRLKSATTVNTLSAFNFTLFLRV